MSWASAGSARATADTARRPAREASSGGRTPTTTFWSKHASGRWRNRALSTFTHTRTVEPVAVACWIRIEPVAVVGGPMRIFVSSSFEDLREHRAAAIRVLRQLGHEVL